VSNLSEWVSFSLALGVCALCAQDQYNLAHGAWSEISKMVAVRMTFSKMPNEDVEDPEDQSSAYRVAGPHSESAARFGRSELSRSSSDGGKG
jgi:hypothetical protein